MNLLSVLFGKKRAADNDRFIAGRAPIRSIPGWLHSRISLKVYHNHVYLEAGEGKPVIFSHGLFGGIFNIDKVCASVSQRYRFLMPFLPMYDLALSDCTVKTLGNYLEAFVQDLRLHHAVIIGSSMGGGAALYYAARRRAPLDGLVLCGSSGLSNIPLSRGYFKRRNYDFVREATRDIFFDRTVPPEEMVRDVFNAIQQTDIVLRSIRFTKAATNQKMEAEIKTVPVPVQLVWGRQDPITPVEVAPRFRDLLPDASLAIIEECGHVPTQEKPGAFMEHLGSFLNQLNY